MNAELAVKALSSGEVIQDNEYYYCYTLPSKEDMEHLCPESEAIYKYSKSSGEFISFSELLEMQCEFEIIEVIKKEEA